MRALLLSFLLGPAAATVSAQSGPAAAGQIFDFGAGARGAALGGAYTAAVHDATSLDYNPAGLGLLPERQLQLMHAPLYGGAAFDSLAYVQNFKSVPGGWGVRALHLGVAGVEGRDALNAPAGSFSYSETALGYGFGVRGVFLPELSLGAGIKYLRRALGTASDSQMGADLGAQYGPVWNDRLTFGLSIRDAVSRSAGNTSEKLPTAIRAGAAWRIAKPFLATLELGDDGAARAGLEYDAGFAALRVGYQPEGFAFGGGIGIGRAMTVDLAMLNSAQLGFTERVSLTAHFGAGKPKKLSILASSYLQNGLAELEQRRYVEASVSIDRALGVDPGVGGGDWKRRAARLHDLVQGMNLAESEKARAELAEDGPAGHLAQRAVQRLLAEDDAEAMLLSEVAAGAGPRDSAYWRLMNSLSRVTRQTITRENVIAPGAFVQERLKRAYDAIYARRYDAAVRACREALLIDPTDALAWTRLGSAHFAAGEKAPAREAYEKALAYEPGNDKLHEFMRQNFKD
jgi:hypothetical protein